MTLPLVLLLLLLSSHGGAKCPPWPTASSPPPPPPPPRPEPMPPLRTQPPPDPFDGAAPSSPPTTDSGAPITDAGPTSDLSSLLTSKARADAPRPAPKRRPIVRAPRVGPPAPHMSDVSVANIQTALIKRGAKLVKDGLYGPKTAAAWIAAARRSKLSPMITRRSGKIARVPTSTYAALSGPVVP